MPILFFITTAVLVSFSYAPTNAYKILYYCPRFGDSHTTFIGSIADKLVEAGHNVTILMPEMNSLLTKNGSKLAKIITIPPLDEVSEFFKHDTFIKDVWIKKFSLLKFLQIAPKMTDGFTKTCENLNEQKELLQKLKDENFEIGLTEVFDGCFLGLIKVLNIPSHVITSPSSIMDSLSSMIGLPLFPSYVPATFSTYSDSMSYMERIQNFIAVLAGKYFFTRIVDAETQLYRRLYGDDFTDLQDIAAEASFVLTNGEPLLDFPHPSLSKVVDIAGLGIRQPQPLSKEWNKKIGNFKKMMLVSFGSVAQSSYMPPKLKQTMLNTFAQFPDILFIWKYETDDMDVKNYKNVILSKWLPQNDLLFDKRMVGFVTHGGMNSVVESTVRGIPMVVVPLFAEQNRNAAMACRVNIAVKLSMTELHEDGQLAAAIAKLLNDSKYMKNVKRLAKMIAKKPISPRELLLKHVEFAGEFGHLPQTDPLGRKMPFYKLYMLDFFCASSVDHSCCYQFVIAYCLQNNRVRC